VIAKAKKVSNFRKTSTVVKSKTRKKEKNGSGSEVTLTAIAAKNGGKIWEKN